MRITPILTRSALMLAGATLAVGIIACTAGTSTDNAIPALDVPAPVSESTWTDAPIERLPAPEVVVTTPPAVEVAPIVGAPVEVAPVEVAPVEVAPALPEIVLPPCVTEDSMNCYWDADKMGNGGGTDFVNIDGWVYYPSYYAD